MLKWDDTDYSRMVPMKITDRGRLVVTSLACTAAFATGMFAPWDRLPWNQVPTPAVSSEPRPTVATTQDVDLTGWSLVDSALADALAEGTAPDAATRVWTDCLVNTERNKVVCPDGYTESW